MARKTKEDAEATRLKLLDAAQAVFYEKGVASASLAEVAQRAGYTRGAIYWHFSGKVELFNALLSRATLPFEQALITGESLAQQEGALTTVLSALRMALRRVTVDEMTRQIFEIALYKTESIGELTALREKRVQETLMFTQQMERMLLLAAAQNRVTLPVSPASAVHGLHAMFCGVLQAWLLHPQAPFDLEAEGMTAVSVYLRGLGFAPE